MRRISKDRSPILAVRGVSDLKSKFLIICAVAACVALLCPALASARAQYLGCVPQSFAVLGGTQDGDQYQARTPPSTGDLGVDPGSFDHWLSAGSIDQPRRSDITNHDAVVRTGSD